MDRPNSATRSKTVKRTSKKKAQAVGTVSNIAEPIKLAGVRLAGVSVSAALPGHTVSVQQRMSATSEDPHFHAIADGLAEAIEHLTVQAGRPVSLSRANDILLVVHEDDTADLWVDTVATSLGIILKRSVQAGHAIFSNDVADVLSVNFPAVRFKPNDRVVYLFRKSWRFGMCFKLDAGPFDSEEFSRALGFLYRGMAFRNFYDALANESLLKPMIDTPFVEIMPSDVRTLISPCEAGFPLENAETELLAKFDQARMDHILQRWLIKPAFAKKRRILESAIKAFCNDDSVSCIKIVTTEIEGILNNAYKATHGAGTRQIAKLLAFVTEMAEQRAGARGTLLFPVEFARYLREYTYASFDPENQSGVINSRHAVGHGAADDDAYIQNTWLHFSLDADMSDVGVPVTDLQLVHRSAVCLDHAVEFCGPVRRQSLALQGGEQRLEGPVAPRVVV